MAPCKKKGGAVGAMPPTHYLSKPRGGGGVGIQGPGPAAPPLGLRREVPVHFHYAMLRMWLK